MLLTACSAGVDGTAQRQQATGLEYVLPTTEQVASAVGNRLDPTGPAVFGSINLLPNGIRKTDVLSSGIRDSRDAMSLDCLGAATPLMRVVYERGEVNAAAMLDFARFGAGVAVSNVHTGVVRFASDAEAARMFAAFVGQWRSCDQTAVTAHLTPTAELSWTVTDVRVDGGILSATVVSTESGGRSVFPAEHAIGVVADCIVDVDVAVTGTARPGTRAADLVRAMLADISR